MDALLVKEGEVVQPGQIIGKLVPVDSPLQVVSFLAERDCAFAKPGDEVQLELDQLPHAQYGTLRASVARIGDDLASPAEIRDALGEDQKLGPELPGRARDHRRRSRRSGTREAPHRLLMNVRFTLRRQRVVTLVLKPLQRWFRLMARLGLRRRRVRFVPQMEMTECGAASLAMILAYHGHHAPLSEVRHGLRHLPQRRGRAGDRPRGPRYGLAAQGVRVEMEQVGQLTLPAILHWDFDHFLVLERLTSTHAVLVDPASGRRTITLDEMGRHFTGVALMLAPTPSLKPRARTRPSLGKYREIFRQVAPEPRPDPARVARAPGRGPPVPGRHSDPGGLGRRPPPARDALGPGIRSRRGRAHEGAPLDLVRSFVVQGLRTVLDFTLMTRFLNHLLHLPLGFFMQREAGDLVQRVHSNATIQNLVSSQSISALLDGLLLVGYAALMLAFDWRLGLVIIGFAAMRVVLLLVVRERSQLAMAAELTASGREYGALLEALSGLETTKASGAESRMIQRWAHRMTGRVNGALERRKLTMHASHATVLLQGLSTALVFLVGGEPSWPSA